MTYILPAKDQVPPMYPATHRKAAMSCERPGVFLVRAWTSTFGRPAEDLLAWILHVIGRLDYDGLVWWGYTYDGLPHYMDEGGPARYTSGLTIQRYTPPSDTWGRTAVAEGRWGHAYGPPEHITIPQRGINQPGDPTRLSA